jgi:hypothetical protein
MANSTSATAKVKPPTVSRCGQEDGVQDHGVVEQRSDHVTVRRHDLPGQEAVPEADAQPGDPDEQDGDDGQEHIGGPSGELRG